MTRIPELEQELVAAAARLQSPRRVLRPAARAVGAAAAVALVAVIVFAGDHGGRRQQPPGVQAPPPTTTGDSAPKGPLAKRQKIEVTEEGVPFSFTVPTAGWERFSSSSTDKSAGGPISINKSIVGPQGAEAILFWTSFPYGDYADPCDRVLRLPVGASAAALAAAVSTAPGTELVGGPSNVTVGGRPAKHVALTVRENVGCDPGFFYTWRDFNGGALWPTTDVGSTIRVWIVDVDGTRLFIEGETTKEADGDLEQEVQQIVQSIRFE